MTARRIKNTTKQKNKLSFSLFERESINPYHPEERKMTGGDYITWGSNNKYPQYLYDLYLACPTLNTIINGTKDYIIGNGINVNPAVLELSKKMNTANDDMTDIIEKCAVDLLIFGGFVLQVIYDKEDKIGEVVYVDIRNCRMNEDETEVFVSKKWGVSTTDKKQYPFFNDDKTRPSEVLFYKSSNSRQLYPVPSYISAIIAIETEVQIQKFHYNSIVNGFASNVIVNINNGIPTDDEKGEFERNFKAKYSGPNNSGNTLFIYNDNKEQAATIEKIPDDNFDKKYAALYTTTRQNIYASFRAIPALFGIMTETTGFSQQEFNEAFQLYNRTVVAPRQKEIQRVFEYVLGVKEPFTFKPFNLQNAA